MDYIVEDLELQIWIEEIFKSFQKVPAEKEVMQDMELTQDLLRRQL